MLKLPFFGPPNVSRLLKRRDVPGLIAALHYNSSGEWDKESSELRTAAATALGTTDDPRAVAPLVALLDGGQWVAPAPERLAAISALGNLRDPQAAAPLTELLKRIRYGLSREISQEVGRRTVQALVAIEGPSSVRRLLPPWVEGTIAEYALPEALSAIEQESAIAQLTAALADADASFRSIAVRALGRLAAIMDQGTVWYSSPWQWEFLVRDNRIVVLLLSLAANDGIDDDTRNAAVAALAKSGDPRVAELLRHSLSNVVDHSVQPRVARALAKLGDRPSIPALVVALTSRKAPGRRAISDALDSLGWSPSEPAEQAWRVAARAERIADLKPFAGLGAAAVPAAMALWFTPWATPDCPGNLLVHDVLARLLERHAPHFAVDDLTLLASAGDLEVRHETHPDTALPEAWYERVDISAIRRLAQEELVRRAGDSSKASKG